MKKSLLTPILALTAMACAAQTTYNFFDPADCDADGWLWFDNAERVAKYCGKTSDFKIRLIDALYENEQFEYPETVVDVTAVGWNVEGVQGGEGAKTGAIILPESDFSFIWSSDVNGGGILMQFADLAKLDLFVSVKGDAGWADDDHTVAGEFKDMYGALYGGEGMLAAKDCKCIDIWYSKYSWGKVLSEYPQYQWLDIDTHEAYEFDWDTEEYNTIKLGSKGIGKPVTAYILNNNKTPWYIHGIRAYTYTDTSSAGVEGVSNDTIEISIDGNRVMAGTDSRISVYGVTGVMLVDGMAEVDCSNLPSGMYVITATDANGCKIIKMVK